jgi:hypothetical protein
VRQYSADNVKVSWFGADLSEGLAAGTFLQVARNAPTWTQKPNGLGGVVRLYNPDLSGTVSLQIDAESKTHQVLVTLANTDRIARAIVGPLLVTDKTTAEVTLFNKAHISTIPNIQKGTQAAVLSWVFNFEAVINQSFALDRNVVP